MGDAKPMSALVAAAWRPVDGASLGAWRVLFGSLMAVAQVRFVAEGWVESLLLTPAFRFAPWPLTAVPIPPAGWLYALHGLLALCGVLLAIGVQARPAALCLGLGVAYIDALDVTNYLNHHWLVVLLCLLAAATPCDAAFSVDGWCARRSGRAESTAVPAYVLWLLRGQVATVYLFASVAKMGPDWLLHGWPLNSWLLARSDWPWLGPLFARPETAIALSWAAMLYDLTIPALLLWRPSRRSAIVAVLCFHAMTALLFRIGIFPYLMTLNATLLLDPNWPRRLLRGLTTVAPNAKSSAEKATAALPTAPLARAALGPRLAVAWMAFQLLLPMRTALYPGQVLWAEEGMRYSWRVMVREKHGAVSFRVRLPSGAEVIEEPRRYLAGYQEREMASQPDLILQLAHHIAERYQARGYGEVAVFADALVSLNGRPPQPLVDPKVDLARQTDGLWPKPWIPKAPLGAPPRLGRPLLHLAGGGP